MSARALVPVFTDADRIRKAVETSGLDVAVVGARLGKSRNTVSNWMHGRTTPDQANLRELARICGVSLDWLRGRDSNPQPSDYDPDLREGVAA